MEIGTKIRKVRELKSYTQEYMATRLGISQPAYAKLEKDDSDLTLSRIKNIADILEIKVEDLINFSDKYIFNNHGTAHDKSFSVNYQGLDDKQRLLYEKTITLLEEKISLLESRQIQ